VSETAEPSSPVGIPGIWTAAAPGRHARVRTHNLVPYKDAGHEHRSRVPIERVRHAMRSSLARHVQRRSHGTVHRRGLRFS
jgi:hypothetical protein